MKSKKKFNSFEALADSYKDVQYQSIADRTGIALSSGQLGKTFSMEKARELVNSPALAAEYGFPGSCVAFSEDPYKLFVDRFTASKDSLPVPEDRDLHNPSNIVSYTGMATLQGRAAATKGVEQPMAPKMTMDTVRQARRKVDDRKNPRSLLPQVTQNVNEQILAAMIANLKPLRRDDIYKIAIDTGLSLQRSSTLDKPAVLGSLDQLEHFARAILRHSLGN